MPISLPARAVLLLTVSTAAAAASPTSSVGSAARPGPPDPLDAKAEVPALRWESAFARFQRGGDDKPIPWREANDTVTRIGGWRVYAREAQPPEAAVVAKPLAATPAAIAPAATSPANSMPGRAMPMPAGHAGHKAP